jgi:hypothetical protein
VSLTALSPVAIAQQPHLSPVEIGQIADAVFNSLIPPDSQLSGVPVAERRIVFDFQQTMAAFAEVGTPAASFADLHMRTPVQLGTEALLDDCSPHVELKCAGLGWRVYASIEPVSVTSSQIIVRAGFSWADRSGSASQLAVAPEGVAYLVGFATEMYLVRTQKGEWKYLKQGFSAVG